MYPIFTLCIHLLHMYTLKKFILLENDASYFITIYATNYPRSKTIIIHQNVFTIMCIQHRMMYGRSVQLRCVFI